MRTMIWLASASVLTVMAAAAIAQPSVAPAPVPAPAPARPTFDADGTVNVPAFRLPPSDMLSAEARAQQAMRGRIPVGAMTQDADPDINRRRAGLDRMMAPRVAQMRQLFPVNIVETRIANVPVRDITPAAGDHDRQRVLINLHGGAFSLCWDSCSLVESLPIASLGKYRVVSVNYRMAPEHRHPAGVEDVAAVYAALLRDYAPGHIGIFGCSAGGVLTAQTAAWLPAHGLPQAGAIGIFGAGGVRFMSGDSAYIAGYVDGSFPPPSGPSAENDMTRGYFDGVDRGDAMASPALHRSVMAQFPPSLIITGTRAMDMSPAIVTNSALMSAGVETDLIVGEGMGHCYIYTPQLPESQAAYAAIIAHFREHLR